MADSVGLEKPATDSSKSSVKDSKKHDGDDQGHSTFKAFLRVFTFGRRIDYVLAFIGLLASIGSGVGLATVNLVLGKFMTLLSDSTAGTSLPDNFMSQVSKFSLYFVYIGIGRLGCTYIYTSLLTYVAYHLTNSIRCRYLRAAFSQETGYFDQGTGGSISTQATSNGKLIHSGISEKLGLFIQAIATFIAAFIIAFATHWKLTLIIICIVPALLVVGGGLSVIDANYETKILKLNAQSASYAENILSGIRAVHAFSLRPRIVQKYEQYLQNVFEIGKKKNPLYGVLFGSEYFIIYAGMGLAFWQGIQMLARRDIPDIGTVFTVLFSVTIAAGTISTIAPHMMTFTRAASAAAELFILIDRESQINPLDESGDKPQDTHGVIDIDHIMFNYPSRPNVRVLDDFSLHVPAGKVTALVGASGSGKSTIVGLLERWYQPSAGSIRLDGKDIAQLNLKWLRTNIRLVQQEPVLFNGSVFENIANGLIGTPWETAPFENQQRRVEDAARLAFAHDFIMNLPHGYDSPIGEKGGLLSGGQKQRIAIARSIISEPKILLLDEATSALDPHAEGIVQQALDRASRNRTTIVIAHKLATIRNADNIVVMSKGKIVEQGQHDQLVSKGGAYANLVKAQDLSATRSAENEEQSTDEEMPNKEAGPVQSLARYQTAEARRLTILQNREDFGIYKKSGILRNIANLVIRTPELRVWYLITLVCCAAGAAIFPGQALLLANVMDIFNAPDMVERGNFIALMYLVMSLGCIVVYFGLGWSTNTIAQTINKKFRHDLLDSILKQDLRFFDRPENTVGALTSRLDSHPQAIQELMGFNIALVILSAINILASSILSLVVSWKLGVMGVLVGLPPMLLAGYTRIRLEAKMDTDMGQRFSQSASMASEAVLAIRTVSSLAMEEHILKRYTNELDQAIRKSTGRMFFMMIWFSLTQSIEYFILGLGFWWGSKLIHDGDISFYQLIVSFIGVYFSGQAAAQLFSFSSSFTKANEAVNYYFWITSLSPLIQETTENQDNVPSDKCQNIDFQDVQFSYPLAPDLRILKGVSLTVRMPPITSILQLYPKLVTKLPRSTSNIGMIFQVQKGQFIALVGASGCGKSTMISLLERFYDPTQGTIRVDSSPLSNMNPILYRQQVALVQQEPTLFPGTIMENISYGLEIPPSASPNAPISEVENACRAANIWDFICSLPDGLQTPCGTSGSQLSGGQRQRIAIARALIRNPRVILLDEATSALDTESERVVQGALMQAATSGERITVAVAHRLSTVREADCIFVFSGGRIVECGRHGELVEQGGIYAKMCEAQNLDAA
ncbi:P-loop containing nucleoside triphosphate hydrolase protein [Aspergillus coremiiformis]|uniref:P-loop containing nucleoside triphosphate hydrolase protein n=1 Tax=Aspergillus coremiiformis TaxID=138285 RepID=A0A5N6Z966_9EURO|nr:P-loop containing nucleoside triphosphate hydrolase protein [Aspergillus coremiiformis]